MQGWKGAKGGWGKYSLCLHMDRLNTYTTVLYLREGFDQNKELIKYPEKYFL